MANRRCQGPCDCIFASQCQHGCCDALHDPGTTWLSMYGTVTLWFIAGLAWAWVVDRLV